ncbi:MAG: FAD-binding oxidoreductase [Mycobacteriaceae bacterium]
MRWLPARVVATRPETPHATRVLLDVPRWPGHRAGNHLDVRLRAADGYTAQRSYSIASAPGEHGLQLVVELLDDGEVSPWLAHIARSGDELEVSGPIGGHLEWTPTEPRPLQLVAGGSGVVPFLAVLNLRERSATRTTTGLLVSARSPDEVIGADTVARTQPGLTVTTTLSRYAPPGWEGLRGRLNPEVLARHTLPPQEHPLVLVCGPTTFVEMVADTLVTVGHDPADVHTERFGASGA